MTHHLNHDRTAAVAADTYWLPINAATPIGAKMLLIERAQGVAYTRTHFTGDGFDHWHPLPRFHAATWAPFDSEDDQK